MVQEGDRVQREPVLQRSDCRRAACGRRSWPTWSAASAARDSLPASAPTHAAGQVQLPHRDRDFGSAAAEVAAVAGAERGAGHARLRPVAEIAADLQHVVAVERSGQRERRAQIRLVADAAAAPSPAETLSMPRVSEKTALRSA